MMGTKYGVWITVMMILFVGCAPKQKQPKATRPAAMQQAPPQETKTEDKPDKDAEYRMAENARGTYNEGVAAARAGRLDQAEQAFKRVLRIDSRAHPAAFNLGVLSERKGDDAAAKNFYFQALEMNAEYAPALSALSKLEIRTGRRSEALGLLKQKATSFPKNLSIINIYADALIANEQYQAAIIQAKRSLKIDERNADAMLIIGKANLRLGRYELASAVFGQVVKIAPNKAEVYFLRSAIRLENQQKAAAIADLKTAIKKRPNYVEAMNNLSSLYLLSGNYGEASKLLQKAVKLSPSWGLIHLNYGTALRGIKRYQQAKVAFNRALELDAKLVGAIFNMGILYFTAEKLDKLDRLSRLKEAKRLFAKYQTEMGSRLSKLDEVYKYTKEVQTAIEREETRLARETERKKRDAERTKQREAEKTEKAKNAAEKTDDAVKKDQKSDSDKPKEPAGANEDDGWF